MSKLTNYKQMYEELKNCNLKLEKDYSNLEKEFKDEKKNLNLKIDSLEKQNKKYEEEKISLENSIQSKTNELNNSEETIEKLKKELLNVGFSKEIIEIKNYSENSKINRSSFQNGYESILSACWGVKGQTDITDILKEKLQDTHQVHAIVQNFGDPAWGKNKEAFIVHKKTEEIQRLYPEISLE